MCGTPKEKPVQVSTVSKEESHRRSYRVGRSKIKDFLQEGFHPGRKKNHRRVLSEEDT